MPQNSHPVIRLYKRECNHGTCLEFPRKVAGILMHLFDLFSDAPNPAQSSVVWHTKVFPKCQKTQMLEAVKNCLIRRPKVRIAFGLASNKDIYDQTPRFGNDFILVAYCRDNLARLAPKLDSCASTYKLSTGEVRNAPRQSLSPWMCMGSSICK